MVGLLEFGENFRERRDRAGAFLGHERLDGGPLRQIGEVNGGGRWSEETVGGREARKARCVADAVEAKAMSVVVMPGRAARRFASSASVIRWPIPGVAIITTCGGRAAEPLDATFSMATMFSCTLSGLVFCQEAEIVGRVVLVSW